MANPEDETTTTTPKTESAEGESTAVKSAFLEKVSDIPVVNAAKEYGTAAYNQVKSMNRLTNLTLSKAESTLLYFAMTAKPFLEKVQPQAKLVDDIACRGLEAVEAKAPFIMKPPEELVEEARKLCSSTLESGFQKVDGIKTMGTDALSSVKSYGVQKANSYLAGTEQLVDKYLPPAFGESSKEESSAESQSLSERATHLTTKLSHRMYGHGVKHFIGMQKVSQDSLAKLAYTVELLQHLKENYSGKTFQEYVEEAKVKANWMWEELNKEPATAEEAEKSLEQRLLSLARRLTSTLVYTYSTATASLPLTGLPQACVDGARAASTYAADLFTQFDQATNTGEVATTLLQKARSTIAALDTVVKMMVDNAQPKENIEMEDLTQQKPPEEPQSTE